MLTKNFFRSLGPICFAGVVVANAASLSAQEADMEFVRPLFDDDKVDLREGFRGSDPLLAGRSAVDEAWERAQQSSSRPDRQPEQEYGGLIYRTSDGTYGFTSPRSGAGWAGEPNPGGHDIPATNVYLGRGIVGIDRSKDEFFLLTPDREVVVGTYHIHPPYPLDGTTLDAASRIGPSGEDRDRVASLGLPGYVRGPDGVSEIAPDGTISMISGPNLEVSLEEGTQILERPFICGPYEGCDNGRDEVVCSRKDSDGLSCSTKTNKPCISFHRLPAEMSESGSVRCQGALKVLRQRLYGTDEVVDDLNEVDEEESSQVGQGLGLGGALAEALSFATKELSNAVEESVRKPIDSSKLSAADLRAGVQSSCNLDRPLCQPVQ